MQRFAQNTIAQLEELHLGAVEERVEAELALGHARDLVGELRDLVSRHPLRERLHGQLMLALYRSGRQAEALEVFQGFRRTLSEELGLEPGPGLAQLDLAILTRDPALDLPAEIVARKPESADVPTRFATTGAHPHTAGSPSRAAPWYWCSRSWPRWSARAAVRRRRR